MGFHPRNADTGFLELLLDFRRNNATLSDDHDSMTLVKLAVTDHFIGIVHAYGLKMTFSVDNDRHLAALLALNSEDKVGMTSSTDFFSIRPLPPLDKFLGVSSDLRALRDGAALVGVDVQLFSQSLF